MTPDQPPPRRRHHVLYRKLCWLPWSQPWMCSSAFLHLGDLLLPLLHVFWHLGPPPFSLGFFDQLLLLLRGQASVSLTSIGPCEDLRTRTFSGTKTLWKDPRKASVSRLSWRTKTFLLVDDSSVCFRSSSPSCSSSSSSSSSVEDEALSCSSRAGTWKSERCSVERIWTASRHQGAVCSGEEQL